MTEPERLQLRRVLAGIHGGAVHALVFEYQDGSRTGRILAKSGLDCPLTDAFLQTQIYCRNESSSRLSSWVVHIDPCDYVVKVSGRNLIPGSVPAGHSKYLCHSIHLHMSSGKTISFNSRFSTRNDEVFNYTVDRDQPALLRDVSFDGGRCTGVRTYRTSIHLPFRPERMICLPKSIEELIIQIFLVARRIDAERTESGEAVLGIDVWWRVLGMMTGFDILPPPPPLTPLATPQLQKNEVKIKGVDGGEMSTLARPTGRRRGVSLFKKKKARVVLKTTADKPSNRAKPSDDTGIAAEPNNHNNSFVFHLQVPDIVTLGNEFSMNVGRRTVRVRCPPTAKPGQVVQFTIPPDLALPPDSEHVVRKNPIPMLFVGQRPAFMVRVPQNIRGGQRFHITIQGLQLLVTCPPNVRPGSNLRIVLPPGPPPPPNRSLQRLNNRTQDQRRAANANRSSDERQLFEIIVPNGVTPGQQFTVLAGGIYVLINCPRNASPGQRVRFNLPFGLAHRHPPRRPTHSAGRMEFSAKEDGWIRAFRIPDRKFQWIRMGGGVGNVDSDARFDFRRSAYVRKIDLHNEEHDQRPQGSVSLVPVSEVIVDFKVKSDDGTQDIISTGDILATMKMETYEEKMEWFQDACNQLRLDWNQSEGYLLRMNIRRDHFLSDSLDAVMKLTRKDLRKVWRFEFVGEPGIEASGSEREWYQLVTEEIFDPTMGMWQSSATNQMRMQINPASGVLRPDDHLVYFHFLGRVMGKALFDQQLISGHMVPYLYKHILGCPIAFYDLKVVDEYYYSSLKQLNDMDKDQIEYMCLDFTTTEETLGVKQDVDLLPDGSNIEVTGGNLPEYLEACLKYRMLDRIKPQLSELLLGFFDVIPESLLTIFDFHELELLMCGLPDIDMDDWKQHTEYSGVYHWEGYNHETCKWFWEVVSDFDFGMKARLLQFVTGTSGIPARGFAQLQGVDGNIRKFTIHGVPDRGVYMYPRSQTSFNRIDLPPYESKRELEENLKFALNMAATDF